MMVLALSTCLIFFFFFFFFLMIRRPPISPLFPYTTLFRSNDTATTEIYTLSYRSEESVGKSVDLGGRRIIRSEERRVGKEWRYRWSPYHLKKKQRDTDDPIALRPAMVEHVRCVGEDHCT